MCREMFLTWWPGVDSIYGAVNSLTRTIVEVNDAA